MIASVSNAKQQLDYFNICRVAKQRIKVHAGKDFGGCLLVFQAISDLCNQSPWGPVLTSRKITNLSKANASVKNALADDTGYTSRSVQTYLQRLEEMEIIRCTRTAGKDLSIEMLCGFIGARKKDRLSQSTDMSQQPAPEVIESRPRKQRQERQPPAPTEPEPYRSMITRLGATGRITITRKIIDQAAAQAMVDNQPFNLEAPYLVDWLAGELVERVGRPAAWLAARFRLWPESRGDYVADIQRQTREHDERAFYDKLEHLLDGVEIMQNGGPVDLALEGLCVPFDDPRFNEVARSVAEKYKLEHDRPIPMSELFERLAVKRMSGKDFGMVPVENALWK